MAAINIGSHELYPSRVVVDYEAIGSDGVNRALSGKGYRKEIAEKRTLRLEFESVSPLEWASIRAAWFALGQDAQAVTFTPEGISAVRFQKGGGKLSFPLLDGATGYRSGALTLAEE